MATPAEAIEDAVTDGIKSVQIGTEKVDAHSIPDLIAADKHLGAKTQASSAARLIFNKISPPGAA